MKNKLFEVAPLLPLAVCLMAGIVMGRYVSLPVSWWFLLLGELVITLLLWRFIHLQTIGIVLCFVLLGATLMERQLPMDRKTQAVTVHDSRLSRSKAFFLLQRDRLLQRLSDGGVEGDAYAVVAAMVLGDKSALTKDLRETYSVTGASHVLALSGLHLGIIYMLLSLLVLGRRWRMFSQLFLIISIWGFVFLVGMSMSVVRAAIMISVYALLSLGHRERMSVNTLAFTAIVMLLVNPLSLYDMGFQLSFMAVLAIQLFCPILERIIPLHIQMEHRWLKALWGLTSVSLAAQIGTAPLIAYYFGRFATYFLLSNFVVIPLATLLLYLALLSICTFWWSGLQSLLVVALSYIVILMNHLLEGIAHLPGCSIEGIHLSILQLACIYLLIGSGYVLLSLRSPRFR